MKVDGDESTYTHRTNGQRHDAHSAAIAVTLHLTQSQSASEPSDPSSHPSIHLSSSVHLLPAPNPKSLYPGVALRRDACKFCRCAPLPPPPSS
ncbi:hypothetical protein CGRA01v4_08059 [Colletotrichum graminicola]|nr:hypothetical protein CGRA01v4_08059 [Colletotrichum graminicola]